MITSTMHFTAFFTTLVLAGAVLAVPNLRPIEAYQGSTTGRLIVQVKPGVSSKALIKSLGLRPTHSYENINSFAGNFDDETLQKIRASTSVESISEDGIMHTMTTITQTNAPWGLARISSNSRLTSTDTSALTYTYIYDSVAGQGVDVYVVDTGIYVNHTTFEGRARWGNTFGGYASADGNGHGTHCAGTIAGAQYGVAKKANVIAVKVLSDAGSGSVADIVNGLNWVISQAAASGRPSVVSMSLGGGASTAMDNAIGAVTSAGIHAAIAAGNSNTDAANTSPARAPSAVTVGASTITDTRASFSNYGAVVDIWAPGQNVISSWIGSTTATNNISGTSMATPHVAGAIAYLISLRGNTSPAGMSTLLKSLAIASPLTGVPSGTINNLLHIPLA